MLHFDHFYNFAAHLCEVYTLRTNSSFLCWKIKSPTFSCLKRKKIGSYKQIRKWKTALIANSDVSLDFLQILFTTTFFSPFLLWFILYVSFLRYFLLLFCLCLCVCDIFFRNKRYILWYTVEYVGRWVRKTFLPDQFPQTRLPFFDLICM